MAFKVIKYYIDCPHCDDGVAQSIVHDFTRPTSAGIDIEIDIEMSIAQTELTCTTCGCSFFIGDVDVYDDANGECPDEDDDNEDEDDDLNEGNEVKPT